jgi:general secretion pathway protein G
MKSYRSVKRGFTLVEILIVVIILGILAAIVIPQFTNASTDARESSARSLVQTVRSAIELYKLQHGDTYPTSDGAIGSAWDWSKLTGTSTYGGKTVGPYLQSTPVNPLNNLSTVTTGTTYTGGFHWDTTLGKMSVTNAANSGLFE